VMYLNSVAEYKSQQKELLEPTHVMYLN